MRKVFLIMVACAATLIAKAQQNIITATLAVKGNCEQCKERIENAADIKGVKLALWDEKKQTLTVTYRSDKISLNEIEKAVAASGHDTQNKKSEVKDYNKLPACCRYRDKSCEKK